MKQIDKIDFRQIGKEIEQRNQKIPELKLDLLNYITVDENLNVVVAEEHREKVRGIRTVIDSIPAKNAREHDIMKKARELATSFRLTIDRSGHTGERPEVLNLQKIETEARTDQMKYQYQKKAAIVRSKETPKEQLAAYGCLQPMIPLEPIEEGLAECKRRLEAVASIRKQLEPFFEGE